MKNKILIAVLLLIILGTVVAAVRSDFYRAEDPLMAGVQHPAAPLETDIVAPPMDTSIATESPKLVEEKTGSYAYLFRENRQSMTSNIVGYFAGGAFAWYVPDWLVENWTGPGSTTTPELMIFAPKVRPDSDFSDIVFEFGPSTEILNAATLYEARLNGIPSGQLLASEVLLNKHTEGGLTLIIETNTRIYHVRNRHEDNILDTYYIDGNGKTLTVTFSARADTFPQFSDKIRDMVEGIGEIKAPQG